MVPVGWIPENILMGDWGPCAEKEAHVK